MLTTTGAANFADVCPGTVLPDVIPELKVNRFAANADGAFVDAKGVPSGYTIADTGGCSATQIAAAAGLGSWAQPLRDHPQRPRRLGGVTRPTRTAHRTGSRTGGPDRCALPSAECPLGSGDVTRATHRTLSARLSEYRVEYTARRIRERRLDGIRTSSGAVRSAAPSASVRRTAGMARPGADTRPQVVGCESVPNADYGAIDSRIQNMASMRSAYCEREFAGRRRWFGASAWCSGSCRRRMTAEARQLIVGGAMGAAVERPDIVAARDDMVQRYIAARLPPPARDANRPRTKFPTSTSVRHHCRPTSSPAGSPTVTGGQAACSSTTRTVDARFRVGFGPTVRAGHIAAEPAGRTRPDRR